MATVKELAARRAAQAQQYEELRLAKLKKASGQSWKSSWDSSWTSSGNSWSHDDDWSSKEEVASSREAHNWAPSRTHRWSRSRSRREPEQPRHRSESRLRSRFVHRPRSRSAHRQRQTSASGRRHLSLPSRARSESAERGPQVVFVTADSKKHLAPLDTHTNGSRGSQDQSKKVCLALQDIYAGGSRGSQDRHRDRSDWREARNSNSQSRQDSQDSHLIEPSQPRQWPRQESVDPPDDLAEFASSASKVAFKEISQQMSGRSTRDESIISTTSRHSGSQAREHPSHERGISLSTVTTQASLRDARVRPRPARFGKRIRGKFGRARPVKLSPRPLNSRGKAPQREAKRRMVRKAPLSQTFSNVDISEQQHIEWSSRCRIFGDPDASPDEERSIELNMSKAGLNNAEIILWCSWMGEQLSQHKGGYMAKVIDFSKNSIGAAGASRLCRLLEMHKVSCVVFKLFNNDLNDKSASEIGRYLTSFNRAPVSELHLSHNHITARGLKWLLACLAMHPAYPRWDEDAQQFLPLWLRMEQNSISKSEVDELLRVVNTELDISICFMKRYGCTAKQCFDPGAVCGLKHNCVAHLNFIFHSNPAAAKGLEAEMKPHSRPFFTAPLLKVPRAPSRACRQKPFVLYEDRDIACVFKPADWVCNPTGINPDWQKWSERDRDEKLDELIRGKRPVPFHAWILLHFGRAPSFTASCAYGLAHRLDKDTSGPLLVGKTREGWHFCREQINGRHLLKSYICLVHGSVHQPEGECHAPIDGRNYAKTRKAFISYETGEAAISIWEALAQYEHAKTGEKYSLLHVRIVTGRTHQIRLHMEHMGHPLVGERMYMKDKRMLSDDSRFCRTIFLHKCRIGFLSMDSQVIVRSCSLQMSAELWQALQKLRRLGGGLNVKSSLGSCGLPGAD